MPPKIIIAGATIHENTVHSSYTIKENRRDRKNKFLYDVWFLCNDLNGGGLGLKKYSYIEIILYRVFLYGVFTV